MKRKTQILLALLLVLALTFSACTAKSEPAQQAEAAEPADAVPLPEQDGQTDSITVESEANPGTVDISDPNASPSQDPKEMVIVSLDPSADPREGHEEENEAAYKEYMRVLQEYVVLGTLPDGSEHPYEPAYDEAHVDKYTIWDIDGDGLDELIVRINESIMAGMVEQVWGYDHASGELALEFTGFPECWYTEEGGAGPAAMSPWSHGTGMESDGFWNYHVSIYNPQTDVYDYLASVEQQTKANMAEMGRAGEFSDDYDADGNGILYVINYNFGESIQVLDDEDYEGWRRFYEGGEKIGYALILEWLPLSDFVHPNG